jgi:hypothetical protein
MMEDHIASNKSRGAANAVGRRMSVVIGTAIALVWILAACSTTSTSPTNGSPTATTTAVGTPTPTAAPSTTPTLALSWQTTQGTNGIGRSSYTVKYPNGWAAQKGDANDLSISPDASLLGPGVEKAGVFYFSCGIGSDPAFSGTPLPTPGSSNGTVVTSVMVAGMPGVRSADATSVQYRFQSPSFACLVSYQILAGHDLTTTFDQVVQSVKLQP